MRFQWILSGFGPVRDGVEAKARGGGGGGGGGHASVAEERRYKKLTAGFQ